LAHCTTRLIDPTHRGTYRRYTNNCIYLSIYLSISKFWVKDEGVCMYKSGICDTKPAISLTRSILEPKLLQNVHRNSCTAYRLVTNLET